MTSSQIEMIRQHWFAIKPDSKKIAKALYEKLFREAPSIRHMFNDDINDQACKLAALINFVVLKLHRLEDILPDIREIGLAHRKYNLQEEHFDRVGLCFIDALKQNCVHLWDNDIENAWKELYLVLKQTMLHAIKNDSSA